MYVYHYLRRNKRNFWRKPESAGQEATSTNPRQEREDNQRYTECMQDSQGAYGYSPGTAKVCRNNRTLSNTKKETTDTTASGRYYDAGVFHAVYEQIQPELEYHDKEYLELDQRLM